MILCSCRNIKARHAEAVMHQIDSTKLTCCSLYKAAAEQAGHPAETKPDCGTCAPVFKEMAQTAKGNTPLGPC